MIYIFSSFIGTYAEAAEMEIPDLYADRREYSPYTSPILSRNNNANLSKSYSNQPL